MSTNRRCLRGLLALATALTLLVGCGSDDQPGAAGTSAPTAAGDPILVRGDGFSVRMPGRPERAQQDGAATGVQLEIYLYDTGTAAFTFSRALYPKGEVPDLDKTLTGSAESAGGTLAARSTSEYRGAAAAEATIVNAVVDEKPAVIFSRYVAVNNVVYGMTYLAKDHLPDGPPPSFLAFANSLQFT